MSLKPDYRFFFQNLNTAAVIADVSGRLLEFNRAALELFDNHNTVGLVISPDVLKEFRSQDSGIEAFPLYLGYIDHRDPLLESMPFMGRVLPGGLEEEGVFFLLLHLSSVMEVGSYADDREEDRRRAQPRSKSPIIWVLDTDFNYISFNDAHRQEMKRMWGADIKPGNNLLSFLNDERYKRLVVYNYNRALSGEHFYTIDELKGSDGGSRYFENVLGPLLNDEGTISGLRIRTTELTDPEDVKDRLRMSIAVQRSLIEGYGNIRIASVDRFFRYRAFNDGYRRFMAEVRGMEIRIGSSLLESIPSETTRHEVRQKLDTVIKGERISEVRSYPLEEGRVIYFEHDYFPVMSETGTVIGITVFSSDVTERMNQKNEIKEALAEKEILLREIHFRVKNNLQMISSLMNLQMGAACGDGAERNLQDLFSRVQTLSLIHEQLYQGGSLGSVRGRDFFTSMAAMLVELQGFDTSGIRILTEVEDLEFDLDTAIPLGLIFNELLDNALGHGFRGLSLPAEERESELKAGDEVEFPADRTKEILFSVKETAGEVRMLISNKGGREWSPEEPVSGFGLGLKLASALAEQLGGELKFDFSEGTAVSLDFTRSESA